MIDAQVHTNPFPGLRPFLEEESYLFFGRESQVDALISKLNTDRFLAVVGTSGSGKSSLVNCGLFPALYGGYMTKAGTTWHIAKFRPATDPMREMALALAKKNILFKEEKIGKLQLSSIISTNLQRSKLGLVETYRQARLPADENLLIVVDQFEELFRFRKLSNDFKQNATDNLDSATAFVNLLLTAAKQPGLPIYVVITMRSDFLGDCSMFRGLPEAINEGQYLIPRMKRKERMSAISGPIEVAGGTITDRLLMRLVNDVGDNPDQLSILQHALNRTWAEWEKAKDPNQPLDLDHYNKIGTMSAALDQHAERAYRELTTARAKKVCEKMFKTLTDVSMNSRGTRRPTKLGKLCDIINASPQEVIDVIEVFRKPSRSFLMPPAGTPLDPDTIIDISHESFMRVWKRLIKWTDEEQESVRTYLHLSDAASLFNQGKSSLLGDPYLQFTLSWKKTQKSNAAWAEYYNSNFDEVEEFLEKSKENWLKEEEQNRTKVLLEQRRMEEEQKRKTRIARQLAAVGGFAFLVCLGFAIYGFSQKGKAEASAKTALESRNKLLDNENKIKRYFGNTVDLEKVIMVSSLQDSAAALEQRGSLDITLLSIYQNLLDNYAPYLEKGDSTTYANKIQTLKSYDRFVSMDASDMVPIGQKLNNWKNFVAYGRKTDRYDSAQKRIAFYENYIQANATIFDTDDFVVGTKIDRNEFNMPEDTASSFGPSKIYAWGKLNVPKPDTLKLVFLSDEQQISSYEVTIKNPSTGYRIRYPQTYNSSRIGKKNEVRLYNSQGDLIGRKVFSITS